LQFRKKSVPDDPDEKAEFAQKVTGMLCVAAAVSELSGSA